MMTLSTRLERLGIFVFIVRAAWNATMDDNWGGIVAEQSDATGKTPTEILDTLQNESDQHIVTIGWDEVSETKPRYEMRPMWAFLELTRPTVELTTMWAKQRTYRAAGPLEYILIAFGRDGITRRTE